MHSGKDCHPQGAIRDEGHREVQKETGGLGKRDCGGAFRRPEGKNPGDAPNHPKSATQEDAFHRCPRSRLATGPPGKQRPEQDSGRSIEPPCLRQCLCRQIKLEDAQDRRWKKNEFREKHERIEAIKDCSESLRKKENGYEQVGCKDCQTESDQRMAGHIRRFTSRCWKASIPAPALTLEPRL